jgi:hypothetical protein
MEKEWRRKEVTDWKGKRVKVKRDGTELEKKEQRNGEEYKNNEKY